MSEDPHRDEPVDAPEHIGSEGGDGAVDELLDEDLIGEVA